MTSMEKFHWLDQNPELPNFVFARLRFASRIDPEIARQSLAIALGRQPLAAMEPVFCSHGSSDRDTDVSFSPTSPQELGRDYVSYFLSVTNALSTTTPGDPVSEIRFHSHHAASDGVASIGLINDWLTVYNNLIAGEPAEWNYLKGLPQQAIALFGAAKFIFRKTKTIAAETASTETPLAFPAIRGLWIDAATLKADRRRAADNQIGFTAWCLAKCFIAIASWNLKRDVEHGGTQAGNQTKPSSVWRILLPVSTRIAADRSAVAANRTAVDSFLPVDRLRNQLHSPVAVGENVLTRDSVSVAIQL